MTWKQKLIRAFAVVITPAVLVSKGVENVKSEVQEEVHEFTTKIKIMIALGVVVMLLMLFCSVTIALVINYLTRSNLIGFVVLTCFYLIFFVVLYVNYKNELI